jgi:ATP-binding cassette, subfamily B, bacterial
MSVTSSNQSQFNKNFWHYFKPLWPKASLMVVLLLLGIGLQLLEPQLLRYFIDTATAKGALELLYRAGVGYLLLAVGIQLASAAATYLGADIGWTATNAVRQDLLDHTFDLDMSFHNERTAGEMIERIDGDATTLANVFAQFSVLIFNGVLMLLGILVVLWFEHVWIGLVLTLFTLLQFVVFYWTREFAVPASKLEREADAQLFGFIEERLAGLEDLRANGGGAYAMYGFTWVMREFYQRACYAFFRRRTLWIMNYGIFLVGMAVTMSLTIYLESILKLNSVQDAKTRVFTQSPRNA